MKGQATEDPDDESLSERVWNGGQEVKYLLWEANAPGYSGSTRIYEYDGRFYVFQDGEFHGPFESLDEAENKFDVFHPVDERDENYDVVIEIWSKVNGIHYQRPSLWPLNEYDRRFSSRWVIDNAVVTEPWVGGKVLGKLPSYDAQGSRLVHWTREEYDGLRERYRAERGSYPEAGFTFHGEDQGAGPDDRKWPAKNVHYIQARKAMEDRASWEAATLLYMGHGKVAVRTADGTTRWFKCGDFLRFLNELGIDTGVCKERRYVVLATRWSVMFTAAGGRKAFDTPSVWRHIATLPRPSYPMLSIAECQPIDDPEILAELEELKPVQSSSNEAAELHAEELTRCTKRELLTESCATSGGARVAILASREESTMVSTWTQYLCLGKGRQKHFRMFTGQYDAIAEVEQFPHDEATGHHHVPDTIDGERVVMVEDGYVLVDNMLENDDVCEFDNVEEPALRVWLDEHNWAKGMREAELLTRIRDSSERLS
jgi:hypothetical protein